MLRTLAFIAVTVFASAALAQPSPPCTLIVGATVHGPGAVRLDNHDVLIRGKSFAAVGVGLDRGGCQVIEAEDKVVTAGFIDPWTAMGLVDIDGEASTVDTDNRALYQDPQQTIRAAVRTSLGFNPRSIPIPVARIAGITSAFSWPSGGLIAGQGFAIDLVGASRQEAIMKDPLGLAVNLGARSESRAAGLFALDIALREAEIWRKQRLAIERNQRAPLKNSELDLEALGEVIAARLPLVVRVDRAAEIESILSVLDGKIQLVLVGAAEAWRLADELARRNVAVIIDPLLFGPGGFDQLGARRDNAALLARAGVAVMVSPMDLHLSKKLRQLVGNAIREGLPWEMGLLAVTEVPARTFGLSDHGKIVAKGRANLVIWSGDPFELSTRVERVFIGGKDVPLESRQTKLFERWRKLPPE